MNSYFKRNQLISHSLLILMIIFCIHFITNAQGKKGVPKFKVIAFFTGTADKAHISFLQEAHTWFPAMARQ